VTTALTAATARGLLAEGIRRLEDARLPTARQDVEWLLAAVLGVERFALYLAPERALDEAAGGRFRALIARRADHEPLQHLLGYEDFRGLRLRVTPDVLIPRSETEGLVAWALELLGASSAGRSLLLADIGTGSGAIACALATARADARVLATELSPAALAVADENVRTLGLAARVRVIIGDLLEPLVAEQGRLDMIVANAPYLPSGILSSLPREVFAFEPRQALDGGSDGMAVIRRLLMAAPMALRPGGWLALEIGEEQAGPLAALLAAQGFVEVASRDDLHGVARYLAGRMPAAPAAA
jgi:release factor glutamine methyltransferase